MPQERLSAVELLDRSVYLTKQVGALWLGVLWLTALPLRLFQVLFYVSALRLGESVWQYGDLLKGLAWLVLLSWVVALYGRMVFVRACLLSHGTSDRLGWELFRVPRTEFATALYLSLGIEVAFHIMVPTFVGALPLVLAAGLAPAVAVGRRQIELFGAVKVLLMAAISSIGLWWFLLLMGCLLFVTWINLFLAFNAGVWLMSALGGMDVSSWQHLFRGVPGWPWPAELLPRFLLLGGALMLIEPFWWAAQAVAVQQLRSRETGEDLRGWFARLRHEREAAT